MNLVLLLVVVFPFSLFLWMLSFLYNRGNDVEPVSPLRWLMCVLLPILMTTWGYQRKSLSKSGVIAGLFVGFILTLSSNCFFLALFVFFVSASKVTKWRSHEKKKLEEDFKYGGQRDWKQVISNGGVAAQLAVLYLVDGGSHEQVINFRTHYNSSWLAMAVLGALCCCAGDTFSSEIGSVLGSGQPWLITTFRKVPRGTNGGVTLIGTLSSFIGGALVGLAYYVMLLLSVESHQLGDCPPQWLVVFIGGLSGLIGSVIDSILGALFQYSGIDTEKGCIVEHGGPNVRHISGMRLLDNHSVNLLSSLATSLIMPRVAFNVFWSYHMRE